jgi:hypothetical protein
MTAATLRLKMVVSSVKREADSNGAIVSEEIILQAVYGEKNSPNAQWSEWTPSANLDFRVTNKTAFGKVLPGQFYFADLVACGKDSI